MALIRTGSVTVTAGSLTVTGVGTAWALESAADGTFFAQGLNAPIYSVDSDTQITLALPWAGPTQSGAAYAIQPPAAASTSLAAASARLAEMAKRVQNGSFLQPGGAGNAAHRAVYDNEVEGFVYARNDVLDDILICVKGAAAASWSSYVSLKPTGGVQGLPGTNGSNGVGNYFDPQYRSVGQPAAGEITPSLFGRAVSFPTSLVGSVAKATVAATAASVFSIRKNGVQFATCTFALGSTTGVFAGAATNFAAGDIFSFVAPDPRDATLSGVLITVLGTRT